MSIESLLITIIILLILNFVTNVFSLMNQISWVKAASKLLSERLNQNKYSDIGDLIKNKKYEDAIVEIDYRIQQDGDESALLWYRGMALYNLKRWEESDETIKKAIEMEPAYKKHLQPYLEVLRTKLAEKA